MASSPVHEHQHPKPGPAFDPEPEVGIESPRTPQPQQSDAALSPQDNATPLRRRLRQVERVLDAVVHKVYDVFGAAVVRTQRPNGTTSWSCTVMNEVRLAFWILIILFLIIVGVVVIINLMTGKVDFESWVQNKHYIAVVVALPFCIASTYVTHVQVKLHQKYWTAPKTQIKIVRIIRMVPIYAWSAFIGIVLVDLAPYVDFVRVCYEAYVIYNFLLLLTKYLGGHMGVVAVLKEKPEQHVKWPAPFCCFPRVHIGSTFLWAIKYGTLQYVLITPVVAFAAVVMAMAGVYGDGVVDWGQGYVYVVLIQNFTQLTALYCLVWFYVVTKDDLAAFKPFAKFLVVKSVVFFTFWQGVGISVLASVGVIHDDHEFTAAEIQLGLQDFIICIEMFIAAAVHRWTFGHELFMDGTYQRMVAECQAKAVKAGLTSDNIKGEDVFYDLELEHPGLEDAHTRIDELLPVAPPSDSEIFTGAIPTRRKSSLNLGNTKPPPVDSQRRQFVEASIQRNVEVLTPQPEPDNPFVPVAVVVEPVQPAASLAAPFAAPKPMRQTGGPRKPVTRHSPADTLSPNPDK